MTVRTAGRYGRGAGQTGVRGSSRPAGRHVKQPRACVTIEKFPSPSSPLILSLPSNNLTSILLRSSLPSTFESYGIEIAHGLMRRGAGRNAAHTSHTHAQGRETRRGIMGGFGVNNGRDYAYAHARDAKKSAAGYPKSGAFSKVDSILKIESNVIKGSKTGSK